MSILLIAALSLGQVSFGSDYPFQEDHYMPEFPGVFNTVAIVEPVRRLGPFVRSVTQGETAFKRTVLVDELKVLDSQPPIKGMLRVVVPFGRDVAEVYQLRKGKRYLVFACTDPDGRLLMPEQVENLGEGRVRLKSPYEFEHGEPNEVFGMAVFETRATKVLRLPETESPTERLLAKVANCLVGTDVDNVARVCEFLKIPAVYRLPRRPAPPESPTVAVMKTAVSEMSPHGRAQIYRVFVDWRVEGAQFEFYEALKGSVNDPRAFATNGMISFLLDPKVVTRGAVTEEGIQAGYMELLDHALAAKSPAVRWFLLYNTGPKPDIPRQRKVLQLAIRSDDGLSEFLLRRLAIWNKDPDNVPRFEHLRPGPEQWTNKKELIEYWSMLLGLSA